MDPGKVRFPDSVVRFLRANPGYTKKYAQSGWPCEQAYFRGRVLPDWRAIQPHLPAQASRILDIGCGIAGIDLILYQELGQPRIVLVDKSRRKDRGKTYDVIAAAREFLTANGVRPGHVQAISSQQEDLHEAIRRHRFDLVLSLRGLGYMFPYDIYRETLMASLARGGRMILDIRLMDQPTLATTRVICERFRKVGFPSYARIVRRLEQDFGTVCEIGRSLDYARVCVERRGA